MRELDEHSITDEVFGRFQGCENPSLKKLLNGLMRHIHDFVREKAMTEAEWAYAVEFLTRTGKIATQSRQEFILLSDTLGVSTLVDAINTAAAGRDPIDRARPLLRRGRPVAEQGADIDPGGKAGEPLVRRRRRHRPEGKPLAGATVDVWHSDDEGFYDVQREGGRPRRRRARLRRPTGRGDFRFRTTTRRPIRSPTTAPSGEMIKAHEPAPCASGPCPFHGSLRRGLPAPPHVFVDGDSKYLVQRRGVRRQRIADRPVPVQPPDRA